MRLTQMCTAENVYDQRKYQSKNHRQTTTSKYCHVYEILYEIYTASAHSE